MFSINGLTMAGICWQMITSRSCIVHVMMVLASELFGRAKVRDLWGANFGGFRGKSPKPTPVKLIGYYSSWLTNASYNDFGATYTLKNVIKMKLRLPVTKISIRGTKNMERFTNLRVILAPNTNQCCLSTWNKLEQIGTNWNKPRLQPADWLAVAIATATGSSCLFILIPVLSLVIVALC